MAALVVRAAGEELVESLTVPGTARLRTREVELPAEEHVRDGARRTGVAEEHCLVLGVLQSGTRG